MQNMQDPHGEVQRARSLRLCEGTEDYIDSGLAGDLRNKVGPATGKLATPDLDSLTERRYALRPDGSCRPPKRPRRKQSLIASQTSRSLSRNPFIQ
ncbi:hypothetical protein P3T21_005382 [Paraburkholderia sp. GAS334]